MPEDRDRLFEKALVRHLRAGAPRELLCPDAELLAAYQQRMLGPEEMAATESHIASCARCREILAQLENSEGIGEPSEEPATVPVFHEAAELAELSATSPAEKVTAISTSKPRLGRPVAAVAAIAAGLVLWIGITMFRNRPKFAGVPSEVADIQPERTRGPNSNEASRSGQPAATLLEKEAPAAGARDSMLSEKTPSVSGNLERQSRIPAVPPPPRPTAAAAEPHSEAKTGALDSKRPPEGAVAGQAPAPAATDSKVSAADTAAAPSPSASSGFAGPTVPRSEPAAGAKAKKEAAGASAERKDDAGRQFPVETGYNAVAVRPVPARVAAPGGRTIWSVGDYGLILLSKDGGRTWTRQYSAAQVALTGGSAPSENVCWIAGAGGTLLRTTDAGQHWQSIATPISGDLGGVQAADAQHASIWDQVHNTRYETFDGGASWKPAANE